MEALCKSTKKFFRFLLAIDLSLFAQPRWVVRLWERASVRTALYVGAIYAILLLGIFDSVDFIYFQF